jgi:hypothetical protein
VDGEDRVGAMAGRLAAAVRRAGGSDADAGRAADCLLDVVALRAARWPDPHAPETLHPARSGLILLEDVGATDIDTVIAALLFDSEHPDLPGPDAALYERAGPAARDLARGLPAPAGLDTDVLLERLLVLPRAGRLVALAERLDHARHLHLRPPACWTAFHAGIADAYLPAAGRTDATLERRLRWWTGMFARRWLPRRGPTGG